MSMFNKVTTSQKTGYKKHTSYKEQMSYHDRLVRANAIDLRNNSKIVDMQNGYSKLVPICSDKKIR